MIHIIYIYIFTTDSCKPVVSKTPTVDLELRTLMNLGSSYSGISGMHWDTYKCPQTTHHSCPPKLLSCTGHLQNTKELRALWRTCKWLTSKVSFDIYCDSSCQTPRPVACSFDSASSAVLRKGVVPNQGSYRFKACATCIDILYIY